MRNGFIEFSAALLLCLNALLAVGSEKVTMVDSDNKVLIQQMQKKMALCKNEIERLEQENKAIAKDKKDFRKALDAIVVPECKVVTNTVKFANGATKTTVKKIPYKQEARVRRLAKMLKDPKVCKIYEKYCDNSCAELLEEFTSEWKMAQASYADTKAMMENNNKGYAAEVRQIDADAKREYEATIKEIDDKIASLKRQRTGYIINNKQLSKPPEVAQIDAELRDLEREKDTARKIYNNNKYTQSYAKAGERKMDANDAVLASADLRNQLQNVYMVYNGKLKDDVFAIMTRKMAENNEAIKTKTEELNRLHFIVSNPDMINADVASAIIDKQAGEAISAQFGVDMNQAMAEADARRADAEKTARENEEAEYQKELSRKKDAAQLVEDAENAKLARERERHRMAEEASTRSARAAIAVEELKARIKRQQEMDERQKKLFDENLELRKSVRKRIDAESDFIESLAE